MKLLYLAIAYMAGILLGRFAWDLGYADCQSPSWPWVVFLCLIPLPFLLGSQKNLPKEAMRWPTWASFSPPQTSRTYTLQIALLFTLLTGVFRYISHPITPCWDAGDLAFYNLPADDAYNNSAPLATVKGYVSSYPLFEDTTQKMNVWVQQILLADTNEWVVVEGEVTLKTENFVRYKYGDAVEMRGRLTTPNDFEDFSYREYLARKNIHSLFNLQGNGEIIFLDRPNQGAWYLRAIYAVRARGEALINRVMPEPYAGLANGMLLGIEAGIDDELYEKFNLTGTSHVIVISGSNVAIISAVFLAIGARLVGQRRAMWPALVGIGCYALLVGGDGAVMRAALMGAVFVVATSLGRRSTALVSLAFACQILTLVNPLTLWDVGFQLSSAATAGLILYANGISETFNRWVLTVWNALRPASIRTLSGTEPLIKPTQSFMGGLIQDGLLITIAANITTLPLVVYYFDRLSVVSFLTNLLISIAQPYIMLWGSAGLVLGVIGTYLNDLSVFIGFISFDWAKLFALGAQLIMMVPLFCLKWTTMMVEWTAGLPGASLLIEWYSKPYLIGTYALLGIHLWLSSLPEKSPLLLALRHLIRFAKEDLSNSLRLPAILLKRIIHWLKEIRLLKKSQPFPSRMPSFHGGDHGFRVEQPSPPEFVNDSMPPIHGHQPDIATVAYTSPSNQIPPNRISPNRISLNRIPKPKPARFIPRPSTQRSVLHPRYTHRLKRMMILSARRHHSTDGGSK